MIAIPAILVFAALIAGALIALRGASDGLIDMVKAPDPEHENTPFNWFGALLCIALIVLLAGLVGSGPLAGLVTTAW